MGFGRFYLNGNWEVLGCANWLGVWIELIKIILGEPGGGLGIRMNLINLEGELGDFKISGLIWDLGGFKGIGDRSVCKLGVVLRSVA